MITKTSLILSACMEWLGESQDVENLEPSEEIQNEFDIPASALPYVMEKLEKAKRKAVSLQTSQMAIDVISKYKKDISFEDPETGRKINKSIDFVRIKVAGQAPSIKGYTFIAKLDWSKGSKPLIFEAPGATLPASFQSVKQECEHCSGKRSRNITFIVKSQGGKYMQVGKNCLADFLGGVDPRNVIDQISHYNSFLAWLDNYTKQPNEFRGETVTQWPIEDFLALVNSVVERNAWKYSPGPTAFGILFNSEYGNKKSRAEAWKEISQVTDHDRDFAKETLDWVLSLEKKGEINNLYHNLVQIAKSGFVDSKTSKIAGIMPLTMQREQGLEQKKQEHQRKLQALEFVGKVGDRIDVVVTVKNISTIEINSFSGYGTTDMDIISMDDENGNRLVWKTTSGHDFNHGNRYKIKATIKDHSYYKDMKQTIITRVKIIEELSSEE